MHWRRTNCRSGFVSRENALLQIPDALHQHGIALPGCFLVAVVWIRDLAIALLSFGKGAEHMNFVLRVRIDRALFSKVLKIHSKDKIRGCYHLGSEQLSTMIVQRNINLA